MKCSRDSLLDNNGDGSRRLFSGVPGDQGGRALRDHSFSIGFVLGTIRVLLFAPRVGETTAVIVEAPIMLTASWFVCRWCVNRLDVRRTVAARSWMGLVAFLVLMSAEVGLGGVVFGRSLVDQLAAYGSPAGAIGLAAQVIFAIFPVIQVWRR